MNVSTAETEAAFLRGETEFTAGLPHLPVPLEGFLLDRIDQAIWQLEARQEELDRLTAEHNLGSTAVCEGDVLAFNRESRRRDRELARDVDRTIEPLGFDHHLQLFRLAVSGRLLYHPSNKSGLRIVELTEPETLSGLFQSNLRRHSQGRNWVSRNVVRGGEDHQVFVVEVQRQENAPYLSGGSALGYDWHPRLGVSREDPTIYPVSLHEVIAVARTEETV